MISPRKFSVFFYTSLHFCLCNGLNIHVWKYSSYICISISQKMLLVLTNFDEYLVSYGPSLQDQWANRLWSTAWGPGMSGPDMSSGLWLWVCAGVVHPLSLVWVSQPMRWCHLSQGSDMPDGGGELWWRVLSPCACMWVCIKFVHLMTLCGLYYTETDRKCLWLFVGLKLRQWDTMVSIQSEILLVSVFSLSCHLKSKSTHYCTMSYHTLFHHIWNLSFTVLKNGQMFCLQRRQFLMWKGS